MVVIVGDAVFWDGTLFSPVECYQHLKTDVKMEAVCFSEILIILYQAIG
jgi:hypothetical protein